MVPGGLAKSFFKLSDSDGSAAGTFFCASCSFCSFELLEGSGKIGKVESSNFVGASASNSVCSSERQSEVEEIGCSIACAAGKDDAEGTVGNKRAGVRLEG